MDAAGLMHYIGKESEWTLACAVILMMGILKGQTGRRHHLQAVVNKKYSKLNFRPCLYR